MSKTLTIRLKEELANWLKEKSQRTGVPMGRIVRDQLESARSNSGKQRFIKHIGALSGLPPDLSSRIAYSKG